METEIQIHIERAKTGDRNSQKEIYVNYAPMVLGICKRYTNDDHTANDYLQECFMHLFTVLESFDAKKGKFENWIHRVSTNKILKILRSNKKNQFMSSSENIPDLIDESYLEDSIHKISKEQLLSCIRELPTGYREVLNLFVFEDYSHQQIADALDISENTSRSQFYKAKQFLKKQLVKNLNNHYEKKLA